MLLCATQKTDSRLKFSRKECSMTLSKPFMMSILLAAMCALLAPVAQAKTEAKKDKADKKDTPAVLNFTVKDIQGKDVNLADYQGKVILMVNVASKCGYTPQYEGLEKIYKKYQDQGFVILGFPANNFGHQEPGTNLEIAQFCRSKYDVTFPMFSKISVKGDDQAPLYQYLTGKETDPKFAGEVKWNFEKFLIGKDGKIVERFRSKVTPESEEMVKAVEKELAVK
jgi:glutathione peroxidase